jgi:TrmH family RNA methyltransferase
MESLIYEPTNSGNLGTIIRSAAALKVKRVCVYDIQKLLERGSRSLREVKKAAMGADSLIKITSIKDRNLLQKLLEEYNGRKIVTVCDAKDSINLFDFVCQDSDLVLFGNERYGLPREIIEREDVQRLRIPMQGNLNSLNVSCAFTVIAYEYIRQNKKQC